MPLSLLLLLVLSGGAPAWGADVEVFPDLDLNDPAALQEASRVLDEELKLAARPRTYLIVDLVSATILIKDRGIDLHRVPLLAWSWSAPEQMTGTFRLVARPPVVRRKVDPSSTTEQEPISLADMPTDYRLIMTPAFNVDIVPAASDAPLRWAWAQGKRWWGLFLVWIDARLSVPSASAPALHLTLSREEAQSLAWSLVDGMPLVVRRPTDK